MPNADPSRHPPIVRMIKGKHHPVHVENVYKRKDGSTFVGNLHAWTARTSNGELILEGFVEDITRRKRMEEELLRAKEAWERTFASVPDPIAILDNQHRIQRVNEAMARRLGVKAEDAIGLKCYEALPASIIASAPRLTKTTRKLAFTLGMLQQAAAIGQFVGPVVLASWVERFGWSGASYLFVLLATLGLMIVFWLRRITARS